MTPERWRKAKEIFQTALETGAEELPAFLDRECAGDFELRDRVERMLTADAKSDLVIDRPAVEGVAQLFFEEATSIAGMTFGHYRIERELGRGGMGQVYLARDTRLDRPVAFKLLPETFSRHPERVRRFQQEARAVSALNHPSIITIHEIGETEGLRFIITEYVDGQTLRETIAGGERDLTRLLKIVVQVAAALEAAHSAGICHRDIKPENIMLRHDGYVKVLDFGLAKTTDEEASLREPVSQSSYRVVSTPGLVLGTLNYMSPEQARGLAVDSRTDIFSLGVVLYEAIAGRLPFQGATTVDLLVAITGDDPTPLTDGRPEVPGRLSQIIDRALRKDRDERYQTIGEMRRELEEVLEALRVRPDQQEQRSSTSNAAPGSSSAEYLLGRLKRHRLSVSVVLAVLVLTASVVGYYRILSARARTPPIDPANLRFTKLTTLGNVAGIISPDGNYILYGQASALIVKQLVTGNTTEILPPRPDYANYGNIFSVDSNYVYCWFQERRNPANHFLERISLVPGPPQKVLERVNTGFSFSRDGRRIAFLRGNDPMQQLILADADGNNERVLATQPPNAVFRGVAWSPDSRLIAASISKDQEPSPTRWRFIGVRVADGREEIFNDSQWSFIRNFVWLPDGSGVVLSGQAGPDTNEQLWFVPHQRGNPIRLTPELASFAGVSITADGSKLVTNQSDRPSDIWVVPLNSPDRAVKLTQLAAYYGAINWTSDGRLVYRIDTGTRAGDIGVMAADGSGNKQLAFGVSSNESLAVAPDGRYVVFSSDRGAGFSLWRMNQDGSDMKQLTRGPRDTCPVFAPDGKSIFYESTTSAEHAVIYRLPIDGGTPVQIAEINLSTSVLAISPDGQRLAYWRREEARRNLQIIIQSVADGRIQQQMDGLGERDLQWSPDGKSLIYDEGPNVWRRPLNGGPAQRLTNFTADHVLRFSLSADGKNLAVIHGKWTSDVVLINLK